MTSELRVMLHGEVPELDAARVLAGLSKMLDLLGELEDEFAGDRKAKAHTTWRFNRLALGSVDTAFAPNRVREGLDSTAITEMLHAAVEGFDRAEHDQPLPSTWMSSAARSGAEIAEGLDAGFGASMTLDVITNGHAVRTVEVTRQSAVGFRKALNPQYISVGSVTGTLESINLHEKRQAGLWTDRTGRRVPVAFDERHEDAVRDLLGKRVEVWGELRRNVFGDLLSVRLQRYEVLPSSGDDLPLTALIGLAPGGSGEFGEAGR